MLGKRLARDNALVIDSTTARRVIATAFDDAGAIRIELALDGAKLGVACTCPLFEAGILGCRHIWAALTVIAADDALAAARARLSSAEELVRKHA